MALSPQVTVWPGEAFQNSPATVFAHLQVADASYNLRGVKQADLTGITYKVLKGGTLVVPPTAVTVSAAVFDTLQAGTAWTVDAVGFNFAHTLPGSSFPSDGTFFVEYTFTLTGGSTFPLLVRIPAQAVP